MTRRDAPVSPPVVLTIAGSDSGGGAGIQADLKTIEAAGGFGTSAITSVTAQNTRGVEGAHHLPSEDIRAQIDAVLGDFAVEAAKTGMLAAAEVVDLVAEYAPDLPNLVVDPVMVAASGDRLLERDAEAAYEALIAEATLVTPNADEAAVLTDVPVEDEESAVRAGRILVTERGADAALVKGGHVPGESVRDVLVTAEGVTTVRHDRVATDATHGSGCALSSAIATELARGGDLTRAVTAGVDLLGAAVRYNLDVGEGPGAVHHLVGVRDDADLGGTIAALTGVPGAVGEDAVGALAGPPGVSVAAATPYAEEPEDVVAIDAEPARGEGPGDERAIRIGADEPLPAALLAAREAEPAIRFALACRHDDAVADALGRVEAPAVPALEGTVAGGGNAVARQVTRAVESAPRRPVAVGLPDAPGAPTTLLVAPTADVLVERARALADAVA